MSEKRAARIFPISWVFMRFFEAPAQARSRVCLCL